MVSHLRLPYTLLASDRLPSHLSSSSQPRREVTKTSALEVVHGHDSTTQEHTHRNGGCRTGRSLLGNGGAVVVTATAATTTAAAAAAAPASLLGRCELGRDVGGLRDARGERHGATGRAAGAGEGRGHHGRVGRGGAVGRVKDPVGDLVRYDSSLFRAPRHRAEGGGKDSLVDDVHNTVGDQDVGDDDLGAVDEDAVVVDADLDFLALRRLQGHVVLQAAAVANDAGDDVVREDVGELLLGEAAGRGADGGEGGVVGREDGDVGHAVETRGEVGLGDGADEGAEVGGQSGGGEVHRDGEDLVDDVDHAAGEVEVLTARVSLRPYERDTQRPLTASVTSDDCLRALMKLTLSSLTTASTTCPPVTFVYELLVSSVGMKAGFSVTSLA